MTENDEATIKGIAIQIQNTAILIFPLFFPLFNYIQQPQSVANKQTVVQL